MLRTTLIRCDILKGTVRHTLRSNFVRCLSLECTHRRHIFRNGNLSGNKQVLLVWRKPDQCLRYMSDLPKHTKVNLPALSPTMETGTIISWGKKEGDKLNEGDLLAEIETDKATMGFETPEEGYLAKILVPAGAKNVPVGQLVCIIVESQEHIAAFKNFVDTAGPPPAPAAGPAAPAPAPAAPTPPPPSAPRPAAAAAPAHSETGGRVYASPLARKLAADKNIDLTALGKGSGIYGSIKSTDLAGAPAGLAAAPAGLAARAPSGAAYDDAAVSNIRGVIAKRLLQSKQTIPHYYLQMEIRVDKLMKLRAEFNKKLEKEKIKITINDFIIKAVAMTCLRVPEANSSWMDTFIRQYNSVDVSVAVSTDRGLITPIVFHAEKKGLVNISKEVKVLAAKAREGKLQPQEFQGGTISVSNVGMFNVTSVASIINPPQSCILGVGGTQARLIPSKNDLGYETGQFIIVTLSCDHRTVDGAVGAQWLQEFKHFMEEPAAMLL